MKRKDILKKLREAGLIFKEGGNHTNIFNAEGKRLSCVGRHTDIPEAIVRLIEKQTGVKLF